MIAKPRLLDLYCGGGGAARGYVEAGWHVTGVDTGNHGFQYGGDVFVRGDALEFLDAHGYQYDAIHASPPCQISTTHVRGYHQDADHLAQLLPATRVALKATGKPWVMENVGGAPMRLDLMLCGAMFGLGVIRHRIFEFSSPDVVPPQIEHPDHNGLVRGWRHGVWQEGPYISVYGKGGGGKGSIQEWQRAMGIDFISVRKALAQAIPPAYAQYIGKYMIEAVA